MANEDPFVGFSEDFYGQMGGVVERAMIATMKEKLGHHQFATLLGGSFVASWPESVFGLAATDRVLAQEGFPVEPVVLIIALDHPFSESSVLCVTPDRARELARLLTTIADTAEDMAKEAKEGPS